MGQKAKLFLDLPRLIAFTPPAKPHRICPLAEGNFPSKGKAMILFLVSVLSDGYSDEGESGIKL